MMATRRSEMFDVYNFPTVEGRLANQRKLGDLSREVPSYRYDDMLVAARRVVSTLRGDGGSRPDDLGVLLELVAHGRARDPDAYVREIHTLSQWLSQDDAVHPFPAS
mmetsp:Transcript_10749/g.35614  ORF Transcript_10749/g.35614 Transcript_10749/m.35614 type:complete len:107 (-) Transcript_10749:318-638(-)